MLINIPGCPSLNSYKKDYIHISSCRYAEIVKAVQRIQHLSCTKVIEIKSD